MQCQCRSWSDLPNDLLFSIASRLGGVEDFIRFLIVCKGWLDSIKPHGNHRMMPCLLEMELDPGYVRLQTPFPSKTHKLRIPELEETHFRFSKDGWLMLSKSRHSPFYFDSGVCPLEKKNSPFLFLFNPLTGAKLDLPNLFLPISNSGVCFTSTPGSSDFMVFAIETVSFSSVTIYTYHPSLKEEDWTMECYENHYMTSTTFDVRFHGVSCNPVFYKGEFYCLDNYGHLGAFDPVRKNWRIVTGRPNNFEDRDYWIKKSLQDPSSFPYKSFMLVDLKGDLISVFVHEFKTTTVDVRIFRLDDSCSKMGWEKVNILDSTGGQLFVGLSTSIISNVQVPHDDGSCNKQLIYFPGFKADYYINDINNKKGKKNWTYDYESYSLKTKEYYRPSRSCMWRNSRDYTWIEFPMSKWKSIFYSKWESICYIANANESTLLIGMPSCLV